MRKSKKNVQGHLQQEQTQDLVPQLQHIFPQCLLLIQTLSQQQLLSRKVHQGHVLFPDWDANPQHPEQPVLTALQVPQDRIPQNVHKPLHTLLHQKSCPRDGPQWQTGPHHQTQERHLWYTDEPLQYARQDHEQTTPSQWSAAGVQHEENVYHPPRQFEGERSLASL